MPVPDVGMLHHLYHSSITPVQFEVRRSNHALTEAASKFKWLTNRLATLQKHVKLQILYHEIVLH